MEITRLDLYKNFALVTTRSGWIKTAAENEQPIIEEINEKQNMYCCAQCEKYPISCLHKISLEFLSRIACNTYLSLNVLAGGTNRDTGSIFGAGAPVGRGAIR
jgi:hypothetical protein